MNLRSTVSGALLWLCTAAALATGGGQAGETTLINPEPAAGDLFGSQIGRSGEWLVIGALNDDVGSADSGGVYIYRDAGGQWLLHGIVQSDPPAGANSWFASVSIDGNWLAVGASRQNNNVGAVYMFEWDGSAWQQRSALVPDLPHIKTCLNPSLNRCHLFGGNLELSGDRLAVGAPTEDEQLGSVYVFRREGSNWVREARIQAVDAAVGQRRSFGNSLAFEGDRLVVGDNQFDRINSCSNQDTCDQGAVYVFERGQQSWQQVAKLEALDGDEQDYFGYSVALSQERIVVGARLADLPGQPHRGATYIFESNAGSWQQAARLNASNGSGVAGVGGDQFGFSVAAIGDEIYVGRRPGNGALVDPGQTGELYHYILRDGAWIEARRYLPQAIQPGDGFGVRAFVDPEILVVGASLHLSGGAAFVYDRAVLDQLLRNGFESP